MVLFTLNSFPNDEIWALPKCKKFQTTMSNLGEMAESSSEGWKTLWKKEKLLVTSNFSFSQVFSKDFYCRHVKTGACLGKY